MTTSKTELRFSHPTSQDSHITSPDSGSARITPVVCESCAAFLPAGAVCAQGWAIARVTAVDRDQYLIRNATGESPAVLTGKLIYASASSSDLLCVGDRVCVQFHDDGGHASIHQVLPRQSFLRRKSPGKNADFQMIAANIDVAFIIQSCHFDFNVRRLERYLVMIGEGHVEPVILLAKTDLLNPEAVEQMVDTIRNAGIRTRVIPFSNVTGAGIDRIRELVLPGRTYCLLGSSGVGKTTLTNYLLGSARLETSAVSGTGEGRHTTTRRQLMVLECGGLLIDMPGMRELGILGVNSGMDDSFADVQDYAQGCRFADCTHTSEPGCAVQQAIFQGALNAGHFQHYLKLKREAEFHEMSFYEKRKKDKAFGKFVRAVTKGRRHEN